MLLHTYPIEILDMIARHIPDSGTTQSLISAAASVEDLGLFGSPVSGRIYGEMPVGDGFSYFAFLQWNERRSLNDEGQSSYARFSGFLPLATFPCPISGGVEVDRVRFEGVGKGVWSTTS